MATQVNAPGIARAVRLVVPIAAAPAPGGDRAFDVPFLPGLTVRLLLWEGDEEFRPTAQILFSDNFSSAFSAEDIAVVGDVLLNAMKGRW